MKVAVVVGGGIAGLVSSILLSKKYVTYLIEKEEECGGLLRSIKNSEDVYFDQGTHIISETNIPELDNLLFGTLQENDWESFNVLKTGNYYLGKMYSDNNYVYAPSLPRDLFNQGLAELLSTESACVETHNMKDYTEKQFGSTFSKHIFAPIMKKITGCALEELHPSAVNLFTLSRIIVGDEHMSRELKKSPFFDSKLSYSSYNEGVSAIKKYYPQNKRGIGQWISMLVNRAMSSGVKIMNGRSVKSVGSYNNNVRSIELDDGAIINCDQLIWTISAFPLLQAANIPFNGTRPIFRPMTLHHYMIDQPFLDSNYYVYCYDSDLLSYRVTLYPNITNSEDKLSPPYTCTVEVLSDQTDDLNVLNNTIFQELKHMGIVNSTSRLLYQNVQVVKEGFPVPTPEFIAQTNEMNNIVNERFSNVALLGKGSGNGFFMRDILKQVHQETTRLLEM